MRVSLTVRVDALEAMAALGSIKERIKDMSPAMQRVASIMQSSVEKNFDAEGRPKWHPLHPLTIRDRMRQGYWPGKILHRTGALRASIAQYFDSRRAGVGTNLKYAAVHQYGELTSIKGRRALIPARPFLKLTDEEMGEITNVINDYLLGGLK
ncbi:MAG: phage virion morphogenesis protein [Nitrospirae bacterium]|nr:phage virion morphogenesis protein [Nitrospirota bacterium]